MHIFVTAWPRWTTCGKDEQVRRSIAALGERIDGDASLRSWEESLHASAWDGEEVWVHGDSLPAWNVFAGESRARFRAELEVDEESWSRGRGWALCQAVSALPYFWDTNPGMIGQASHALAQVFAEDSA